MRPVFNIKKVITLLVLSLLVPFVGCKKKVTDTMTNGEWLTELTTQAGITSYQQDEPYYLNISSNSPYFSVVQSSVEWELLTPSKAFDPSATVNRENITYGEYLKKFAFQKYMIDSTYGKEIWNEKVPAEQSITKQETTLIKDFTLRLVDSIIQEELLSQEAKKQSLKIDESELKNNVDQWKNSITKDKTAKEYYEKNGITEEVVTDIFKEQMNISALEANYTKNNPVTQAEIDKYYNEHKSEYTNAQVKASHIIIKTQNDDGTEMSQDKVDSAKKQIDEIYAKIKAGEDFAKLAKQYSQDASKDAGGDLGFFSKGQMVKEFEEVAFSMKVGEVSEPFKTKYGYHVVKLTDKKEDTTDPKQVKEFLKGYEIYALSEVVKPFEIVEDGSTFQQNALIKSKAVFAKLKEQGLEGEFVSLSDDSGISVDALGGEPGIYSARYFDLDENGKVCGKNANDANNRAKLISKLKALNLKSSLAHYTACIAISSKFGDYTTHGFMYGAAIDEERGTNGFGYDALFIPNGFNKTLGELDNETKLKISHRSKGLELANFVLKSLKKNYK